MFLSLSLTPLPKSLDQHTFYGAVNLGWCLDHFQRQPNLNKHPLNRDQASVLGPGLFCLGMLPYRSDAPPSLFQPYRRCWLIMLLTVHGCMMYE